MTQRFIMTAFGKDRPGIVADVTKILYENGCNLEDNSMTLLADEFTLVLLFSSPREGLEETLQMECRRLERDRSISAFMRTLDARPERLINNATACTLHVEGMDQAGIVYKISQFLADRNVNINDLKSTVKASPESGSSIYLMDIALEMPKAMTVAQLEHALREVADELLVDITLSV